MLNSDKKFSKKDIILILAAVVAITIIISGFGKVHLSPFKTAVEGNNFSFFVEDKNGGIAVDDMSQTVYFFNEKHRIVAVTDMSSEGDKITWISDVSIKDGEILISGCKMHNNGIYIEAEAVLAYKYNGKFIREVERVEYDLKEHVTVPKYGRYSEKDIWVDNENTSDLIRLPYSTGFLIKNALYWLAIPVVIIIALLLLIKLVNKESLNKRKGMLITIFCIVVTLIYYQTNMVIQAINNNENMVATFAAQMELAFNGEGKDEINAIYKNGVEAYLADEANLQIINETQHKLINIVNENCSDYNMIAMVCVFDSQNQKVYKLLDSRGMTKTGKDVSTIANDSSSELKEGETGYIEICGYDILSCYHYIRDDAGTAIGSVAVATLQTNIANNIVKMIENLTLNLLALFILMYVVYTLFGTFSKDFQSLKSRDKADKSGRALDMCGVFMFVFQIANTIDEVILVYVAKSLCTGMPVALEATLVALPLATNGAGRWIGTFFAGPIIRKFGERTTGVCASVLGIMVMLCMALAVLKVNIYILIACKFAQGVLLSGFMYVIGDTLPLNAKNEDEKTDAMNHSQMAVIGAEIVAALAGGYLSQYVGYQLVYFTGAVVCGLMLIITIVTFGRKGEQAGVAENEKTASFKESWSIFLKKPMLLYLFLYLIPFVMIAGYKNYIFPMFTAGAGVSVLLLSNISVYAKAFTFVIDEPLKQASLKMKYYVTMLVPALIFCIGLIYFLFCPNVLWAVLMYLGIAVVKRMASVGQKLYIADVADEYGIDSKLVQSNYYTIESGAYVLQSPVLSAFVSMGTYIGSALVGAICGVMFTIFALFKKKRD